MIWRLAIILIFCLISWPLSDGKITRSAPMKKIAAANAGLRTPRRMHDPGIAQIIQKNRTQITECFLEADTLPPHRIRIKLLWDGTGIFQKNEYLPAIPQKVEKCIHAITQTWRLPPHPGLSPYAYETALILGAG